MLTASEHLKLAEAADQRAASAADPEVSDSFRALAEQWRELAQHAPDCSDEVTAEPAAGDDASADPTDQDAELAMASAQTSQRAKIRRAGLAALERVDGRLGGTRPRRLALLAALLLLPVAVVLLWIG